VNTSTFFSKQGMGMELMKKRTSIIFIVIGIFLFGAALSAYVIRKEPWLTADRAYQKGDAAFKNGNYDRAFHYLKMAADKNPNDSRLAWTATQMAAAVGNANAAYLYAQKAWKNGRKERDVLQALVQYSFFSDKKQKIDYAFSLVKQMGDNIDKDDLQAEIYAGFGEMEKARRLWERVFARAPQPATANKLARTYLQAGNDSLAFSFLTSCRAGQKLDDEGYGLLARLYSKRGNLHEADLCFQEGADAFKSSDKLQYDHALFLMDTKNFERAASMLDSLITKYPDNKAFETMRISVLLAKGDFEGVLRECDKSAAPINLVAPQRARALIRLNRLAEAEAAYDTALAHNADLRTRLEFGNILLHGLRKPDKARAVFLEVHKAQPSEPVSNLGLATLAIDAKDPGGARKYVETVLSGKKPVTYAYMLLAQINVLEGNQKAALENCDKVLEAMPGFEKAIFVKSQAYAGLGNLGKADELLTSLIQRPAGKGPENTDWIKRALVPLKIKEKKYGDALSIVNYLDRGGNGSDLGRMRFEIYGLSGDLAKARETLASLGGSLDKSDLCYYQSWLAELEGDTAKAAALLEPNLSKKRMFMRWAGLRLHLGKTEGVFEKAPEDSMTVADWSRLAVMAQKKGLYVLCAQCYKQALKHDENNAALLNNYAWASMQTRGFNHEDVLKAIKKAYVSLSARPEVLQTYAEALNKCDKSAECIKILQDKPAQTKQTPALLYQLGLAYEKTGDLRGAVSSFRMMLNFPDSTPDWPLGLNRSELQTQVEGIKQKLGQ